MNANVAAMPWFPARQTMSGHEKLADCRRQPAPSGGSLGGRKPMGEEGTATCTNGRDRSLHGAHRAQACLAQCRSTLLARLLVIV
jgi:hypothetical protein